MAQNKVYLTAFFALLVGFAVLCGCAGEGVDGNREGMYERGTFEGLSVETEMRILQDYLDANNGFKNASDLRGYTVDDIYIDRYFGTYNGCIVFCVEGLWDYPAIVNPPLVIAGVEIGIFNYGKPQAWKDGNFNNLQGAYDQGWLTHDDLRSIAEYFSNNTTGEGLSAELESRIKQDYVNVYNASVGTPSGPPEPLAKKDIWVTEYYGTYNGCVVVSVGGYWAYPGVGWEVDIAGIRFGHGNLAKKPTTWKDGSFNDLQGAYDQVWLTQDDLRSIAEYFSDN